MDPVVVDTAIAVGTGNNLPKPDPITTTNEVEVCSLNSSPSINNNNNTPSSASLSSLATNSSGVDTGSSRSLPMSTSTSTNSLISSCSSSRKSTPPQPHSAAAAVDETLVGLTREELYEKIRKLRTHVKQLRNIVLKRKICHLEKYDESSTNVSAIDIDDDDDNNSELSTNSNSSSSCPTPSSSVRGHPIGKKIKAERAFNFRNYPKRHVALKLAYLGWSYTGLASQEDSEQTIETYLFEALVTAKLIESRATANYHRCGRTDKGVSAFSQVVSIDLRCKALTGLGVILPENWVGKVSQSQSHKGLEGEVEEDQDDEQLEDELDYCRMLNRLLPKDIRILGWAPVRADFSARFDCETRTYKYYFPMATDLDIERMRTGAELLVGNHDFRNFCKLETQHERREKTTTMRTVISVGLDKVKENPSSSLLYVFTIKGSSFVWHQIRCIISILILVGKGLEEPALIGQLLDLSLTPKKPQYSMAVDFPLVLFDVDHGKEIKQWRFDDTEYILGDFQKLWVQNAIKATIISEMMNTLKEDDQRGAKKKNSKIPDSTKSYLMNEHLNSLIMGTKAKVYQKILDRPTCDRW